MEPIWAGRPLEEAMKLAVMVVMGVMVAGCSHERQYALGGKPAANFVEYMEANNMMLPPMPESMANANDEQRMCLRRWFYDRLDRDTKAELDAVSNDPSRKISKYATSDINDQIGTISRDHEIMERGARECGIKS